MSSSNSTQRFSDRVENYIRYRPSYPAGVITALREKAGLNRSSMVADVGAGTGIFTEQLLPHVSRVYAVEPNEPMRSAAERSLARQVNFTSLSGTAEATGLANASVDLVTVAQAFHWFNVEACRREFLRILRPQGQVALIWNERLTEATPFLAAYESLLKKTVIDYEQVNHLNIDVAAITAFYGSGDFSVSEFPNEQRFDFAGLKGRVLSSSYAPNVGHPNHEPMMRALEKLFTQYQEKGTVPFLYTTRVYIGRCVAP